MGYLLSKSLGVSERAARTNSIEVNGEACPVMSGLTSLLAVRSAAASSRTVQNSADRTPCVMF